MSKNKDTSPKRVIVPKKSPKTPSKQYIKKGWSGLPPPTPKPKPKPSADKPDKK